MSQIDCFMHFSKKYKNWIYLLFAKHWSNTAKTYFPASADNCDQSLLTTSKPLISCFVTSLPFTLLIVTAAYFFFFSNNMYWKTPSMSNSICLYNLLTSFLICKKLNTHTFLHHFFEILSWIIWNNKKYSQCSNLFGPRKAWNLIHGSFSRQSKICYDTFHTEYSWYKFSTLIIQCLANEQAFTKKA